LATPDAIFLTRFTYPDDPDAVPSVRGEADGVIQFPWKLIVSGEPGASRRWELYDLGADPGERINRADDHRARAEALRETLRSFLAGQERARLAQAASQGGDAGNASRPSALSRDTIEQLRSLGYIR
jgi:hypothetical protein